MNNLELERFAKVEASMKTFFDKNAARQDELQTQIDHLALERGRPRNTFTKGLGDELKENESLQRLMRDQRGNAIIKVSGGLVDFERKTTVSSAAVGSATSGVLMYDRTPGIVPAARRRLFLRQLFTEVPTSQNAVDFVRVNADVAKASPQTEASDKYENAQTFTTTNTPVRTIATWIPATRQILDDFQDLEQFLSSSLRYAVELEVERQLLLGDNTGQNLNGIVNQATVFDTTLTSASDGWKYADLVGRAVQQVQAASESEPNFIVLPPAAWWQIRLQKTSYGEYIYGDPSNGIGSYSLFGLNALPSNTMSAGKFVVGCSTPDCGVIRNRMDMTVEISTEHSDYFVKNMVAIRAECRLALVLFRPAAYIYGTFTQSPL